MVNDARILVAGGGIGGLALAQALRRGGLDVTVYETDPTPEIRRQGYRIHIDEPGNAALRECLPAEVLSAVHGVAGVPGDLVAFYTQRLEQLMAQTFPVTDPDLITHVDRDGFRRALLTGLDDVVRFGHTVSSYRVTEKGRVRVEFAEGGADEGDLLVGADGIGSAIRRRLVPDAVVRDLGLRCLYGSMPLDAETAALVPPDFERGFCWVSDDTDRGTGFAPMRFRTPSARTPDYLMVTLVDTPTGLGLSDAELAAATAEDLWRTCVAAVANWHPALRDLVAHADPDSFFPITLRAAERIERWSPGPVTLLGDAVHAMPPTGGVGANVALRDAATLAGELLAADRDDTLVDAVGRYESVMLPRGFDAVDESLRMAGMMFPSVV